MDIYLIVRFQVKFKVGLDVRCVEEGPTFEEWTLQTRWFACDLHSHDACFWERLLLFLILNFRLFENKECARLGTGHVTCGWLRAVGRQWAATCHRVGGVLLGPVSLLSPIKNVDDFKILSEKEKEKKKKKKTRTKIFLNNFKSYYIILNLNLNAPKCVRVTMWNVVNLAGCFCLNFVKIFLLSFSRHSRRLLIVCPVGIGVIERVIGEIWRRDFWTRVK